MSAVTPEAILGPALMSALDAAGYVVRLYRNFNVVYTDLAAE